MPSRPGPAHDAAPLAGSPAPGDMLMGLVSAGLFLYVGFALGLSGASGNWLYDGSVTAFTWGSRMVGIGLLVTTALEYFRLPGGALLDLVLSLLAAAGCLVIGAIWLGFGGTDGLLVLLFGLLNGSAARSAWQRWCTTRRWSPRADE